MPCSHCRKPGHTYITCPTISPEEKQRIIDRNTLKRKKQKNKNVKTDEKKSPSNEDFVKVRQEQRERQKQLQRKKLEEMHKAQELQQQWILGCQATKKSWEQNKETSKMTFDILNGCNENEVMIVQKNAKKQGFFEKFFNLFD